MQSSSDVARAPSAAEGPFFGAARGGLRFELVPDDGDEPFAVLDQSGRFSRVLLGRVAVGADRALVNVAVKVQRDVYLESGIGDPTVNNALVDDMWQREARDQAAIASPHVVELLGLTGDVTTSPPVVYCRARNVYFHPPCPETGRVLRTCRDDELLRDAGLRSYSGSLQRYLASEVLRDGQRTFYKCTPLDDEQPKPNTRVRVGAALFRDFAALARAGGATESPFPCTGCDQRSTCYPEGAKEDAPIPAEQRLVALSYYDFAFLTMPALDLTYDELCDWLGGAPWTDVEQRVAESGASGRRRLLAPLAAAMSGRAQWLSPAPRAVPWLEVLRAKLFAFRDVVLGVAAVHAKTQRPHFGIEPRNVMAKIADVNAGVPVRWAARVRLLDLGCGRRYVPAHASRRDIPMRLLPDGTEMYRSPFARSADGVTRSVRVQVERIEPSSDGARVFLRAALPPDLRTDEMRAGDLALVSSSSIVRRTETWMWAEVTQVARLELRLLSVRPADQDDVGWPVGQQFDARMSVFKVYGPACDLYGLGLLLFRALLVNASQSMLDVQRLVSRCIDKLGIEVAEQRGVTVEDVRRLVQKRIDDNATVFHPSALLWNGDATQEPAGYARDLWHAALALAFRLVTGLRDFSYADTHADTNPHNPAALATAVLADVDALLAQVQVELFGREERDAALGAALGDMLQEIRQGLLDRALDRGDDNPARGGL